ncbi:hypothetical protein CSC2_05600 [Clostridium zeae]|uniref:Cyclic lactone autoinducer peptide n=1 Tax=Clostridium zeae TaxID=2759022 RepID=A0ABQ1E5L9_9CLOT|nr:hypothetical protein [Clostridium zeae]GFZ30034.1 hypothetical protein CSC2_05600 [Clostridium zeae]
MDIFKSFVPIECSVNVLMISVITVSAATSTTFRKSCEEVKVDTENKKNETVMMNKS